MGVFQLRYEGPDKTLEFESHNLLTDEGRLWLLQAIFNTVSNSSGSGLVLIDDSGFTAVSATDTFDNINQAGNGWDEFTDYKRATAWSGNTTDRHVFGSVPTRSGSQLTYGGLTNDWVEFTATGVVRGIALAKITQASEQLKDSHPGYRFGTAIFPCLISITEFAEPLSVVNGGRLYFTYRLDLNDA